MVKRIFPSFWLVLVFVIAVLLRLPSLFEPFTYGDEGIYLTLGLTIRKGLTLYSQIHDNKPPLLYLIAALSGPTFAYYRALFFLWSLATVYVFFKLAERIFPKSKKAVIISTFAFAILTNIHTFEGNIGNAENFMMLPTILGVLLIAPYVLDQRGSRSPRTAIKPQSLLGLRADLYGFFLAGVMFSLATLFKVPAAFDFLAVFLFLTFVFLKPKRKNLSFIIYHLSFILIGFLLPILITFVYYATKGAFGQYLHAAFFQNIPYLTSWGTGSHAQINLFRSGLFLRGVALLVIGYWLFALRKGLSRQLLLVSLWFFFSLFAALLSSRPYPHYLIQVLPSLSLLLGFLTLRVRKEALLAFACFSLFAFSFYFYKFWRYPNISYYRNFYSYALGQKSKTQYFADFDPKANDIYQAAEFIINHSLPEEKIFVWGNEPYLYALSRRLPPGRYAVAYHIIDFDGWCETIRAIVKERVKLIITTSIDREFPALTQLLEEKYIKIEEIGEYQFYKLMKTDWKQI